MSPQTHSEFEFGIQLLTSREKEMLRREEIEQEKRQRTQGSESEMEGEAEWGKESQSI